MTVGDASGEIETQIISPLVFPHDVIHKPPTNIIEAVCASHRRRKRAVMASRVVSYVIEAEHAVINQAKRTPKEPNTR